MGIKQVTYLADDEDDLDEAERTRLHATLARSMEDIRVGRYRDASEVLAELQARRSVLRSEVEMGVASLDAGRAIEVAEQDLDRYLGSLAPRRK